uniref:Cyclin-dependent kinase G-2-like n=1 Tax=Nicotiana sylvestris TaxID=4096 RepID=A0A1U7VNT3_NICSY
MATEIAAVTTGNSRTNPSARCNYSRWKSSKMTAANSVVETKLQTYQNPGILMQHTTIIHRYLKTSNLLLNSRGELKICQSGLARKHNGNLLYSAPELLLGAKHYSIAMDMWSVGCIMAELLSNEPLFNGSGTLTEQIYHICRILGTPNKTTWPGFSKLTGVGVKVVNFAKQYQENLLRKKIPATSFTGCCSSVL